MGSTTERKDEKKSRGGELMRPVSGGVRAVDGCKDEWVKDGWMSTTTGVSE